MSYIDACSCNRTPCILTGRYSFPPVRACLFDMDGLLLDTEDLYSLCTNLVLEKYGRPPMPWKIKAMFQGRPGPVVARIFQEWAQLPISQEQYLAELSALQREHFPTTKPLPGVVDLIGRLVPSSAHLALASSSHKENYKLKTNHLASLFDLFPPSCRVLGDDPRLDPSRGKPLPDIFQLALQTINASLPEGEAPIRPDECLVFEDSVAGVEAGRRAGMRVIWCPHPKLRDVYAGQEDDVLAGRTGQAGNHIDPHQLGRSGDGWAEEVTSLEAFPLARYGIIEQVRDLCFVGG
ncbi:hypothetical protein L249_4964 [Ophiocordyceps polyrhachis-furcata BCC 54312]|uniref:Uncharacterized protein n=1 Tax=Ophiocordyceps polyrhachis-furcata BCC 54312 TaxID=1330021 RepID=A0A367L3U7_9HYPO|nr:hypothetical protein L249_4964 [Ophiocordyceps polyrhachis-furcata BCC 54312]